MNQVIFKSSMLCWFILLACSQNKYQPDTIEYEDIAISALRESTPSVPQSIEREESDYNLTYQRKIIKEGTLRYETTDAAQTRNTILKSVLDNKGYLAKEIVSSYGNTTEYNITIRVPAEQFDPLVEEIAKTAKKLDNKDIKTLDVTEEYIDVQARINIKKELENRYKEILKQAQKIEDILKIENEIGTLRADIESLEGRMRYLKDRIDYSTLTIICYEINKTSTTNSFNFSEKFIEAIGDGWTGALWFIIRLINIWPFLILFIGAFIILKQKRKNRKRKKNKTNNEFPPVK